jgi:hypothetical protein
MTKRIVKISPNQTLALTWRVCTPYKFSELRRSETLRVQSEISLIDFLSTNIRIARALLDTARACRNPTRRSTILCTVRRAILSIRHVAEEIEDPGARAEIEESANRLEDEFSSISNSPDGLNLHLSHSQRL